MLNEKANRQSRHTRQSCSLWITPNTVFSDVPVILHDIKPRDTDQSSLPKFTRFTFFEKFNRDFQEIISSWAKENGKSSFSTGNFSGQTISRRNAMQFIKTLLKWKFFIFYNKFLKKAVEGKSRQPQKITQFTIKPDL